MESRIGFRAWFAALCVIGISCVTALATSCVTRDTAPATRPASATTPTRDRTPTAEGANAEASHVDGPAAEPDLDLGIQSFDRAWEIVRDRHYDPDMGGVDWDAVRAELRPLAVEAQNIDELRGVINEMVGRLGLSHYGLMPKESVDVLEPTDEERVAPEADADDGDDAEDADPEADDDADDDSDDDAESKDDPNVSEDPTKGEAGFEVRLIGERMVVTRVAEGGAAAAAGVRIGWIVEEINDRSVQERIAKIPDDLDPRMRAFYAMMLVHNRLDDDTGTEVVVTFLDAEDATVDKRLKRRAKPGAAVKIGNLPPMASYATHRWIEDGDKRIGYLYFSAWMGPIAVSIDETVDLFRNADGFVLDLRGNPGGVVGMSTGVAGHFLTERVKFGTMKTRVNDMQFNANPRLVNHKSERVEPYAGPLAILVDSASGSTSEMFTAGMQYLGRARVFGQTSMGAALPAMMERLPNEDVLLHAVGDYVLPDGSRVEGQGVIPDEPVELTRELLLRDPDPVLTAARQWIRSYEVPAN